MRIIRALYRNILVLSVLIFTQCQRSIESEADFQKWLHTPENGFVQQKKVNNLVITTKYLPPSYLALSDLKAFEQPSQLMFDSLMLAYKNSLTFVMTIQPDKEKKANGDVMYRGVSDYLSYKERVAQMNFGMDEYVRLYIGGKTFKPVLTTFDNTYSLVEHRSLYLVFAEEKEGEGLFTGDILDLAFNDEVFNTGISHFKFRREDIQNTPKINFLD